MSDLNQLHDRVVWFDIPVSDLDRATAFYGAVLALSIERESTGETEFAVLDHGSGVGGCLVVEPGWIAREGGPLLYLNAEGRIRDAEAKARELGAVILQPVHPIGPHGFRVLLRDCEGNRIALHSTTDG
ncbi:MAG: VOC family protein [Planctomycetota bacterium]